MHLKFSLYVFSQAPAIAYCGCQELPLLGSPPSAPHYSSPEPPERSWQETYPKLGDEDVRDAAQNSHKVEDVPGIAEIVLE